MANRNELHYGVVVGINRYPSFSNLQGARRDAEQFAKWLCDPKGGNLPEKNVAIVTVPDAKMPPKTPREKAVPQCKTVYNKLQNFWEAVEDHLKKIPADWYHTRLYFYVSGHGIGPSPVDAALLMADAGPKNYGENISCMELLKYFCKSRSFCEVVIFADCCRSKAPEAALGAPKWTIQCHDRPEVNTAFGCATESGRSAFDIDATVAQNPDELRSYYTKALLQGLEGEAVDTGKGEINTGSLAEYISLRLPELLGERAKYQVSTFYANLQKPITFRKGLKKTLPINTVTITFETDYKGEVILYDGDMCEIKRKKIDGAGSTWTICLNKGLFRMKATDGSATKFKNDGYFAIIGGDDVQL